MPRSPYINRNLHESFVDIPKDAWKKFIKRKCELNGWMDLHARGSVTAVYELREKDLNWRSRASVVQGLKNSFGEPEWWLRQRDFSG
jgi:hypothetical protein